MNNSSTQLDLSFIRSHFPALDGEWTFFDNAGGSQTLKSVAHRIADYLLTSNVQLGASYGVSQLSGARVQEATKAMQTLVNASDPQEIVMGPSTTALIRILSICFGKTLNPGDEVIVSNSDHEANVSPWCDLADQGITVKIWKVRETDLRFHLEDLDALMTERTRLVAVTHTSNVLGTLNPVKEIAEFVHKKGALICVDGVAHAPHRLVDVQDLDVDFYIFSFYKVYGPHYALMYGKKKHLLTMPGLNHYFIHETPYKFQPGNVNFEFAYGMLGIWDYIDSVAVHHFPQNDFSQREKAVKVFDLFSQHEEDLARIFIDFLKSKSNVRIIGEATADKSLRVPTISFVVEERDSEEIVLKVDPHFVGIRWGDFYAKKLIDDLDLHSTNGVIRVSMVHYNTKEEVEKLIEVLEEVI